MEYSKKAFMCLHHLLFLNNVSMIWFSYKSHMNLIVFASWEHILIIQTWSFLELSESRFWVEDLAEGKVFQTRSQEAGKGEGEGDRESGKTKEGAGYWCGHIKEQVIGVDSQGLIWMGTGWETHRIYLGKVLQRGGEAGGVLTAWRLPWRHEIPGLLVCLCCLQVECLPGPGHQRCRWA